ncbi:MAG: hypothetical protein WBL05_03955 [Brooklawnia sp.]|uniref:hypothetical protein n=1 Tax=Brooklawnia sp. TaxID=2699740 RepID=UPI003C73F23C
MVGPRFVLAATGLGVAGFDPYGALLVGAALARGASRWAALVFLLTSAVAPIGLGVLAGRVVGPLVSTVESWLQLPGMVWAFVALAAGVILGWAVLRLRRGARPETPQQHRTRGSSVGAMALAGLAFGLTALLDPAFYAIVSVTARNSDVLVHLVGLVIWFVVAQWLLIGLVAVSLFDRQRTAAARLERAWTRNAARIHRVVTVVGLTAGLLLVVDGLGYLVTGHFLIG